MKFERGDDFGNGKLMKMVERREVPLKLVVREMDAIELTDLIDQADRLQEEEDADSAKSTEFIKNALTPGQFIQKHRDELTL